MTCLCLLSLMPTCFIFILVCCSGATAGCKPEECPKLGKNSLNKAASPPFPAANEKQISDVKASSYSRILYRAVKSSPSWLKPLSLRNSPGRVTEGSAVMEFKIFRPVAEVGNTIEPLAMTGYRCQPRFAVTWRGRAVKLPPRTSQQRRGVIRSNQSQFSPQYANRWVFGFHSG
jgi:hypothetical protein